MASTVLTGLWRSPYPVVQPPSSRGGFCLPYPPMGPDCRRCMKDRSDSPSSRRCHRRTSPLSSSSPNRTCPVESLPRLTAGQTSPWSSPKRPACSRRHSFRSRRRLRASFRSAALSRTPPDERRRGRLTGGALSPSRMARRTPDEPDPRPYLPMPLDLREV